VKNIACFAQFATLTNRSMKLVFLSNTQSQDMLASLEPFDGFMFNSLSFVAK